jgi:hypothetical protein
VDRGSLTIFRVLSLRVSSVPHVARKAPLTSSSDKRAGERDSIELPREFANLESGSELDATQFAARPS